MGRMCGVVWKERDKCARDDYSLVQICLKGNMRPQYKECVRGGYAVSHDGDSERMTLIVEGKRSGNTGM